MVEVFPAVWGLHGRFRSNGGARTPLVTLESVAATLRTHHRAALQGSARSSRPGGRTATFGNNVVTKMSDAADQPCWDGFAVSVLGELLWAPLGCIWRTGAQ